MSKKVVIIGDTGVGKTSILFRYVYNKFESQMSSTFGAGFKSKDIPYNSDGDTIRLNLWDTAGQEKYDSVTKMYFKNAEAAIIVYDITNENSFERLQKYYKDLDEI